MKAISGIIRNCESQESDIVGQLAYNFRLFGSQLELQPLEWHTFVNLQRNPAKNYDVQSAIASILWNDDSNAPYIVQLASILTINLEWMPGAPRELWKLEERVVLGMLCHEAEMAHGSDADHQIAF